MGVMKTFTRHLPLPDPWGLPAPYLILPLPNRGLLGTPPTFGPLIPGEPLYLETPHTWGPLIPGDQT